MQSVGREGGPTRNAACGGHKPACKFNALSKGESKMEELFRIYKTTTGEQREDGSCLVASYGCNGSIHIVTYDAICFDSDGKAYSGTSHVRSTKMLGVCLHNEECKNFGEFIEDVNFIDINTVEEYTPSLLPNNGFRIAGECYGQGHITFFPKYTPRKSKGGEV